jgi:ribosomal protein S18 acetylase RimI-like enzyme
MELAVTVDRAYRRRELGQHLLKQLLTLAFIHGAEIAEFIFDPGNGAIAGLIRTLGVRVDPTLDRAEILRSAFRDVA